MILLKNDQMQFSEKHGKFRDGEKQKYFVVNMDVSNRFSPRIVVEIGSIPNEQMNEFQTEVLIIFE